MTEMACKFCGIPIDYIKEEKTAYEQNGNKHDCPELKKKPKGFPKKWTKKEFKPIDNDLEMAAIKSDIAVLKEEVAKHDDAIRALVHELSFKTGADVAANQTKESVMRNPEEVQKYE
jgi:hypothetical protein